MHRADGRGTAWSLSVLNCNFWRGLLAAGFLGLMMGAGAPVAFAQPTETQRPPRGAPPKRPAPAPSTPATPSPGKAAQPGATPAAAPQPTPPKKKDPPTVGPYVRQEDPKDLTLATTVRVHLDLPNKKTVYKDPFSDRVVEMPKIEPMKYETLQFVFPIVPSTASSDLFINDISGVLRVNGKEVDDQPEILTGYPGGVRLTRWDAGAQGQTFTCRQVSLDLSTPMRCYGTVFDETAAMNVPWPPTGYPAEIATSLQPQLYVELGLDAAGQVRPYDDKVLSNALQLWMREDGIKDGRAVPPVRLAKMIAGKVWGVVQISGDGLNMIRTGELQGMEIQPPAQTLVNAMGSEQDVTALMAALYRKVGLPTRTVIGYDVSSKSDKFLAKGNKSNRLRSWVEFALFDEANNTINWVPVDVARMRKTTNRPPSIDRAWNYFGTHDELSMVTPFALHFHPPTDVVAYGSPGFWGWFVTPAPAKNAEQALKFVATLTAKRGGQPVKDPKNQDPPK